MLDVRRLSSRISSRVARRGRLLPGGWQGAGRDSKRALAEQLENRQLMSAVVGEGLVGNYYADANFQNLAAARTDATVDFDWGTGSPAVGVPAEGFSARWTGQISATSAGKYTLSADSSGQMSVTVDGKAVINDPAAHARRTATGSFTFEAGKYYDVQIDFHDTGAAVARLLWAKAGKAPAVVPQSDLYRLGTGWVSDGWQAASLSAGGATVATARSITAGSAGSLSSVGGTYSIGAGTGANLRSIAGASAAQGQLAYKTLRGDGELVVRLDAASAGSAARISFRDGLGADAAFVDLTVSGGGATVTSRGQAGGGIATSVVTAVSGPTFLKLKRDGNSFAGYVSTSGADDTWTLVGAAGAFMDTFAQAGFGVSGAAVSGGGATLRSVGAAAAPAATFSAVRVASTPALGANLHHLYDSSVERPFVDLVKMTGGFQTLAGKAAPADSGGWPTTSDFQIAVSGPALPAGQYTITFNGPSTAKVASMRTGFAVSRVSYDPVTGAQVWAASTSSVPVTVGFRFTGMAGYGKNVRVLQPGYSPVNTPIYTTRYLNFVKQLNPSSLRFMDWTLTNKTTMSDWSQRGSLTTANWVKVGVAWEACIELCNQVGSDLYINIPGRASDDYVKQLANLVRTKLRADLNVYLEQGNEMWASNFANGPWNYQQSLSEVQAARRAGGESNLNYDHKPVNLSQTDLYAGGNTTFALRRTARRAKQIGDIFDQAWTGAGLPDPTNTRVRVMLAAQVANLSSYDIMLKYLSDVYGNPGNYIYAMAAAPYFTMGIYNDKIGAGGWTTLNKSATAEQLLGTMALSSGAYTKSLKYLDFASHGRPYGVKLAMYEGGHDTFGPFNIKAKKAATLDPRMKTMMKGYLSAFFNQGGTVFHYYTLGADTYDGPYGTWAITNDFNNLNTPKAQAFKEVRQGIGLANAAPSAGVSA